MMQQYYRVIHINVRLATTVTGTTPLQGFQSCDRHLQWIYRADEVAAVQVTLVKSQIKRQHKLETCQDSPQETRDTKRKHPYPV